MDTILDENGQLDGQDSSFYEQVCISLAHVSKRWPCPQIVNDCFIDISLCSCFACACRAGYLGRNLLPQYYLKLFFISNPGSQDLVTEVLFEQASAVQEAGAVACIMINMVGARKIPKQVKIIRFNIEIEIFT